MNGVGKRPDIKRPDDQIGAKQELLENYKMGIRVKYKKDSRQENDGALIKVRSQENGAVNVTRTKLGSWDTRRQPQMCTVQTDGCCLEAY